MDPLTAKGIMSVELEAVDLQALANGQTLEVVSDKGTFWVTRTTMSDFVGDGEHAAWHMAVSGTDYHSGSPRDTNTTRHLRVGETFSIRRGMDQIEANVTHILMPFKRERH